LHERIISVIDFDYGAEWTSGTAEQVEETYMDAVMTSCVKRLAALALSCAIGHAATVSSASAASATASGPSALALAAVVASHGSLLGSFDKRAMARLFSGNANIGFPPNKKISVMADSIICRTSDVDITARSCDLTFKSHKRTLTGRDANELYGTIAVAGVASEGASGSIIESIMMLECTIDPNVMKQKAGGGADCTFEAGQ
jgi:hypothetical protein